MRSSSSDKELFVAHARTGDIAALQPILEQWRRHPHRKKDDVIGPSLSAAAQGGHMGVVDLLLPFLERSNTSDWMNDVARLCSAPQLLSMWTALRSSNNAQQWLGGFLADHGRSDVLVPLLGLTPPPRQVVLDACVFSKSAPASLIADVYPHIHKSSARCVTDGWDDIGFALPTNAHVALCALDHLITLGWPTKFPDRWQALSEVIVDRVGAFSFNPPRHPAASYASDLLATLERACRPSLCTLDPARVAKSFIHMEVPDGAVDAWVACATTLAETTHNRKCGLSVAAAILAGLNPSPRAKFLFDAVYTNDMAPDIQADIVCPHQSTGRSPSMHRVVLWAMWAGQPARLVLAQHPSHMNWIEDSHRAHPIQCQSPDQWAALLCQDALEQSIRPPPTSARLHKM